jgi:hypothetical protein
MTGDADSDHDPYDPIAATSPSQPALSKYPNLMKSFVAGLKDDFPAFRLVPLVFSAGSDGENDIFSSRSKVATFTGPDSVALNPYFIDSTLTDVLANTPGYGFGLPDLLNDDEDQTKDNLTNHLIEY